MLRDLSVGGLFWLFYQRGGVGERGDVDINFTSRLPLDKLPVAVAHSKAD